MHNILTIRFIHMNRVFVRVPAVHVVDDVVRVGIDTTTTTIMDEFEWSGNSKVMFEEVVNLTPWVFRHFPRSAILKGLKERNSRIVTEEGLIEVCKVVSPEKYLEKTMAVLEENRTK